MSENPATAKAMFPYIPYYLTLEEKEEMLRRADFQLNSREESLRKLEEGLRRESERIRMMEQALRDERAAFDAKKVAAAKERKRRRDERLRLSQPQAQIKMEAMDGVEQSVGEEVDHSTTEESDEVNRNEEAPPSSATEVGRKDGQQPPATQKAEKNSCGSGCDEGSGVNAKRAKTPWQIFLSENRERLSETTRDQGKDAFIRLASQEWRNLADKSKYTNLAVSWKKPKRQPKQKSVSESVAGGESQ